MQIDWPLTLILIGAIYAVSIGAAAMRRGWKISPRKKLGFALSVVLIAAGIYMRFG